MPDLLACHRCHGALSFSAGSGRCDRCRIELPVRDGVVLARELAQHSYFDDVFEVMRDGNREKGTWESFYRQQAELVGSSLRDGDIVVDVGCGPEIPYRKGGAFVIGVDASFASIRANTSVDLRLFASAAALPLRSASADVVLCFYSVHHMTGGSVAENAAIVRQVFGEFSRVLKPSGRLLVFEVTPLWPFGALEDLSWNAARRALGPGLDMYFWRRHKLEHVGREQLDGAALTVKSFQGSPWATFPPIFSKPGLRFPRILYPFDICLYEWRLPERG